MKGNAFFDYGVSEHGADPCLHRAYPVVPSDLDLDFSERLDILPKSLCCDHGEEKRFEIGLRTGFSLLCINACHLVKNGMSPNVEF